MSALFEAAENLVSYARRRGLLPELDVELARNLLLARLGLSAEIDDEAAKLFERRSGREDAPAPDAGRCDPPADISSDFTLYELFDVLLRELKEPPRHVYEQDILLADVMNLLMHRNGEINRMFRERYALSPEKATEFFYRYSIDCGYIRMDRVAKNRFWKADSAFGSLDITINLSKPEKSPEEIALMKTMKSSVYPKCMLCKENVGYEGTVRYPPRQNLRVIEIELGRERWFFQYSPYVYYNEHAIALSAEHRPMKIDRDCLVRLLDFVDLFPHYFVGSNADLPIVGGSILTHDHYQAGCYDMPMFAARADAVYRAGGVRIESLHWPLSVLALSSESREELLETAERIRASWTDYDDGEFGILSRSGAEKHSTVTPIARFDRAAGRYILYLALRNNRTSKEHPLGIFHPHEKYHHIKRENIGLIEVMGLAVLPGRLVSEMEHLAEIRSQGRAVEPDNPHREWFEEIMSRFEGKSDRDEVLRYLYAEIGRSYGELLRDSGVFAGSQRGVERFLFSALEEVERIYELESDGSTLTVSSRGATMLSFAPLGREVLHRYEKVSDYVRNPANLNCIVAPNAGRIKNARLGDRVLEPNEGRTNLHSGSANLKFRNLTLIERSGSRLLLGGRHPDGLGGFAGDIDFEILFELEPRSLTLEIRGAGRPGIHVNAANHNYYRLSADSLVTVRADRYLENDGESVPARPADASGPMDLSAPLAYGELIARTGGVDNAYLLTGENPAAILTSQGIELEFHTDQECVVVYTMNHEFNRHQGICLEFQGIPNQLHPMSDRGYRNRLKIVWREAGNEGHDRQSGDCQRIL